MESENKQLIMLKERIIYSDKKFGDFVTYQKALERLLEDSKFIALSLRFPYKDYSDMSLPRKYNNWQLRCCEELYKLIGTSGIKSYAENGLSWTRDSSYLSDGLTSEIEPMIGYIEESEEEI